MRRVSISLPDALYAELAEIAAATGERGYGPANWAGDLVSSELASRRLPKVKPGRYGGRITAPKPAESESSLSACSYPNLKRRLETLARTDS